MKAHPISEGAQAAEEAAMQANDALCEGWLADCGAYPEPCMRERAESLAGMALLKPHGEQREHLVVFHGD